MQESSKDKWPMWVAISVNMMLLVSLIWWLHIYEPPQPEPVEQAVNVFYNVSSEETVRFCENVMTESMMQIRLENGNTKDDR